MPQPTPGLSVERLEEAAGVPFSLLLCPDAGRTAPAVAALFGAALLSACSTSTTAGLERDDPHWYVRELDAAGHASWRNNGQVEPSQASVG